MAQYFTLRGLFLKRSGTIIVLILLGACGYSLAWEAYGVDGGEAYRGLYPSLQVDDTGMLHISYLNYYGADNATCKYADIKYVTLRDGAVGEDRVIDMIENYDVKNNGGNYAVLRLDSYGQPHLAYADPATGFLKYAFSDNGTWRREQPVASGATAYLSFDLDAGDNPHISFYDNASDALMYVFRTETGWVKEQIARRSGEHYHSLRADAHSTPHISYYDAAADELRYAYRDAAGWHRETAVRGRNRGTFSCLDIDAGGNPHMAYYDNNSKTLWYAARESGFWLSRLVSFVNLFADDVFFCSLKIDTAGTAHVSYSNATRGRIEYAASPRGFFWEQSIPETESPYSGPYNSLALDKDNNVYIAAFTSRDKQQDY